MNLFGLTGFLLFFYFISIYFRHNLLMSWWKILLFLGVVGGIGYVLYSQVDFAKVSQTLVAFPGENLVGVLLLSLMILVIKAARFWTLLRRFGIKTDFWDAVKVSFAGSAASPLPGGESLRGVLLYEETKKKLADTSGAIISQAYFEIAVATVLMSTGLFIDDDLLPFVLGSIGLMILLAFILAFRHTTAWIKHFLPKTKLITGFFIFLEQMQHNFFHTFVNIDKKRPRKVFLEILILTTISHTLGGVLLWLVFSGLNIDIGFFLSVFLYCAAIVISTIGGFSPGGLGLTEGGLLGLMALITANTDASIAAIVLFRFSTLVFSIFLGVIVFLIFYAKTFLAKWRIIPL